MARNIIFCADGTWNHPDAPTSSAQTTSTNVYKFYANLRGNLGANNAKEQEFNAAGQVAKYIDGVGDDSNWLEKLEGGAFGIGMVARIVRGYTFISRNYQPGDQIYLVGFSRGAYTVRALAGMIANQGLLKPEHLGTQGSEASYRTGAAAWERYRRAYIHSSILADFEDFLVNWHDQLFNKELNDNDFIPNILIHAVGVWDTVGALGIPVHNARGACIDVFNFADTQMSSRIAHGFHAVSRDEQRAGFTPTLWEARGGVDQQVFPGCHADIGGGYPENGLSDITLQWMTENMAGMGVNFANPPRFLTHPNPLANAHQEWKLHPEWKPLGIMRRTLTGLPEHSSVTERKKADSVVAQPDSPNKYL